VKRILALETSSDIGSVALLSGATITERTIASPREQTGIILPHVQALLADGGFTLSDLDGVSFGRGPGSFTGLRVAAAVAQGLGLALDLPLLPVSSLAAIAQGVLRTRGILQCLVCVDARMGEVFWASYAVRDGRAQLRGAEALGDPTAVQWDGSGPWAAAGSGFAAYVPQLAALTAHADMVLPEYKPLAQDLIPQALYDLAHGRAETFATALPVYLRRADAWQR
jgi:tRNA threonylcarbamoyladenosine biosynthesis protein TsaB